MIVEFITIDRDTPYLFVPSVQNYLLGDHLARFIVEIAEARKEIQAHAQLRFEREQTKYPDAPGEIDTLLVDTGYFSEASVNSCEPNNIAPYGKTHHHSHILPRSIFVFIFYVMSMGLSFSLNATESLHSLSALFAIREYDEQEERPNYSGLLKQFGQHKNLPPGFELQALLALSHYPELEDVRINFIVADVSIPLSSRPRWSDMLRSAQNRTYQVIIDTNLDGPRDVLLLKNQPFNAQVGIIGHELAHTVYYLKRSFFGIVGDAFCQLSDCRIRFERATDRRLIDYGLGWQRYDHALFVRRRFTTSTESAADIEGGGGAYMSPAELLRIIENHELYVD